jgi:N-acetylglucosaminyl-diphospho-decaprenol L-rhamnosyltransferase
MTPLQPATEPRSEVESPLVHAVVVAYRSADTLRGCVAPLAALPHVTVTVVDNASPDDSAATVADLPVELIRAPRNGGFSYGCNLGAANAEAPYLLFLNPDARIGAAALEALVAVLRDDPETGLVGPRILDDDGSLSYSLRRFPRLRSTYAQALFLHRVWPRAPWTDELIRDAGAYERPARAEWLSGACMLVRRSAYEQIGGFDEGFFLYCEDMDLCRRLRDEGLDVRYEPHAVCIHEGGASAPRAALLPVLAASRIRYARKHRAAVVALLERAGVVLGGLTHALVTRGGRATRRGNLRAVVRALTPRPRPGLDEY